MTSEERAAEFFKEGYNCSQATALAFADRLDVDEETLLKLASPFGGGLGRLREVCGCVSAMALVAGAVKGYSDPKAREEKTALYALVQKMAAEFREENGSIVCRELLEMASKRQKENKEAGILIDTDPHPEERTAAYYQKRPCAQLAACAAKIIEKNLF